jgi:hypothetical protein
MFCLADEIRDVLVRRFRKPGDHFHVLLELFDELLMFLIAPSGTQGSQLVS